MSNFFLISTRFSFLVFSDDDDDDELIALFFRDLFFGLTVCLFVVQIARFLD